MKRVSLAATAAIFFFALAPMPAHADDVARPNVVLILADDLGYMDIGVDNPKSFYQTPHIDALAARGTRFTQGYAACSVCSPTRASIMTGKYPTRLGITDWIGGNRAGRLKPAANADHLALEEVTLAERFRDSGYATFFAGKWHLGAGEYSPNAQGFGPGLTGYELFYYPPSDVPPPAERDDPKTTDRIADAAIRFIESHRDRPFFAYLPFQAVHTPIEASPPLVEKYRRLAAGAPPDAWGQERDRKVRLVQNVPAYAAMIEQMDSAIGRIVAALDGAKLAQRTIIVFTSDNGGLSTSEGHPTSNAPLRAGKGWPYEGGIRTPWIIVAPGVGQPGSVRDTPVISMDLYPTLLALAGLPADPTPAIDGVSLVPLLKGDDWKRPAPLFWHYPHYSNQGGAPCGAVREGDWKLIEWFEDDSLELYNLPSDPGEQNNLAGQNRAMTDKLRAKLVDWRKETHALMPTANP